MKDNPTRRPRVLVLTSTFPRWENDPEPAFIYELCRRLISYYDITVLAPRTPGWKIQETMEANCLLSCYVCKGHYRWYIFS